MYDDRKSAGFYRFVPAVLQGLAIALPLALMAGKPVQAAEVVPVTCAAAPSKLDARIAAKADEGIVALGRFVNRTRMIYQLDVTEAVARAAHYRQAATACNATVED